MHWNFKTRIARSLRRPEHAAQSQLLAPSAVAFEIRAPDFLRSRSKRNHLLDDANGDGTINPPGGLDDWPECKQSGLQIIDDGADQIAGRAGRNRASGHGKLENLLSTGRHQVEWTEATD